MRILCALVFVVAACGGTSKKPEGAVVNEGSVAPADTCCCKAIPITSAEATPVYEIGGRMDCSAKDGECVDEVQCQNAPAPEGGEFSEGGSLPE